MKLDAVLITFGCLFLAGLVADEIGHRTRIPRVTLLILVGVLAGQSGLGLLPPEAQTWYELLATVALTMVAFLIGGTLSIAKLRHDGRGIIIVSAAIVLSTIVLVTAGLMAVGAGAITALVLAGISTATDPAALSDVVKQSNTKGSFPDMLRGIVAIDDAWGLIAFSFLLVIAKYLNGDGVSGLLSGAVWDIGGATVIGLALGLPAAKLSGRLRPGEPMQSEALAIVFLCAGLAIYFKVSFLLAGIVAGFTIANTAHHHTRAFHEIEHIEWPFMILFFILAGASANIAAFAVLGTIGIAFVVLRIAARVVGGWLGATLASLAAPERRRIGVALLPQAGVAVGMALVARHHFPDVGEQILTITIATTIVFEILGPVATTIAVNRVASSTSGP